MSDQTLMGYIYLPQFLLIISPNILITSLNFTRDDFPTHRLAFCLVCYRLPDLVLVSLVLLRWWLKLLRGSLKLLRGSSKSLKGRCRKSPTVLQFGVPIPIRKFHSPGLVHAIIIWGPFLFKNLVRGPRGASDLSEWLHSVIFRQGAGKVR